MMRDYRLAECWPCCPTSPEPGQESRDVRCGGRLLRMHFHQWFPLSVIQLRKGGLSAFVDEAIKIVSSSDLMSLHEKNKQNNPQYKGITEKLTSAAFGQLIRDVLVSRKSEIICRMCLICFLFAGWSRSESHPGSVEATWHWYWKAFGSVQSVLRVEWIILNEIYGVFFKSFRVVLSNSF